MLNFDLDTLRSAIKGLDLISIFCKNVGDAEVCSSVLKVNYDVSSYMEALIEELFCSTIVDVEREYIDKGEDIYDILSRQNAELKDLFFDDFIDTRIRDVLDLGEDINEYLYSEECYKDFKQYLSDICMYKVSFKTKLISDLKDSITREFFMHIPLLVENIFSLWNSEFVGIAFDDKVKRINLYCLEGGYSSFDYEVVGDTLYNLFTSLIINFKETDGGVS